MGGVIIPFTNDDVLRCQSACCSKGICCVECDPEVKGSCGDACDIAENLLQDREIIRDVCRRVVRERQQSCKTEKSGSAEDVVVEILEKDEAGCEARMRAYAEQLCDK